MTIIVIVMTEDKNIFIQFWELIQDSALAIRYGIYFLLSLALLVILIYATIKGFLLS